jgi:Bacterial SH3 domain
LTRINRIGELSPISGLQKSQMGSQRSAQSESRTSNGRPSVLYYFCPFIVAVVFLSGCALTVSGQKRQGEVTRQTTANREPEEKLARLQLLLLEEKSRAKELNKKLNETILEVVRARAKLQSLESKAEAASTLAEGEIALKALKTNAVGFEKDAEILQAGELLKSSNLELKKENYGGALYLAIRAKALIKESEKRSKDREKTPMRTGEVPFTVPVPLRLVSSGNIREGPGLDSKVLFLLREGSALVGYSYQGLWVRVRTEAGRGGWIYYSLVDGR